MDLASVCPGHLALGLCISTVRTLAIGATLATVRPRAHPAGSVLCIVSTASLGPVRGACILLGSSVRA
eukprot:3398686-Pleurochrysis_carterae.AAC.1